MPILSRRQPGGHSGLSRLKRRAGWIQSQGLPLHKMSAPSIGPTSREMGQKLAYSTTIEYTFFKRDDDQENESWPVEHRSQHLSWWDGNANSTASGISLSR